jgi:hypothetical protein
VAWNPWANTEFGGLILLFQHRESSRAENEPLVDEAIQFSCIAVYFGEFSVTQILLIRALRIKYHFQRMIVELE